MTDTDLNRTGYNQHFADDARAAIKYRDEKIEALEAQLADSRTPCLWTRCAWPEWATGCGEYTASAASHCPFCGHPVEYLAVEEVAPHE